MVTLNLWTDKNARWKGQNATRMCHTHTSAYNHRQVMVQRFDGYTNRGIGTENRTQRRANRVRVVLPWGRCRRAREEEKGSTNVTGKPLLTLRSSMETTSFRTSSTSILRDVFHGKISDTAAHGVGRRVGRDDGKNGADETDVTLGLRTKTYESQTRKRGLPENTKTRSCKKTGKYRSFRTNTRCAYVSTAIRRQQSVYCFSTKSLYRYLSHSAVGRCKGRLVTINHYQLVWYDDNHCRAPLTTAVVARRPHTVRCRVAGARCSCFAMW